MTFLLLSGKTVELMAKLSEILRDFNNFEHIKTSSSPHDLITFESSKSTMIPWKKKKKKKKD